MIETLEDTSPIRFSVSLNDRAREDSARGGLAGWRWPNRAKPPLLFLHATGFCASAYRQLLTPLQHSFDIYALDLRGHGRSSLDADAGALRSWRAYVDDISAFLDQQQKDGWVLSGHSLGAATALIASVGRRDVSALKLIEPVAVPRWLSLLAKTPLWPPLAQRMRLVQLAARRRNGWPTREEVLASYARKPLFKAWAPGVLEDYLEDGLKEVEGALRLSCAPAWEAATFAAQGNDFWPAAKTAPAPVKIFAAGLETSTLSAAARRRFEQLGATLVVNRDLGHLAPMQNPAEMARFLAN